MQQSAPFQPHTPIVDSLTGALARPSFIELLGEHAAHAVRSGSTFSLLLADIDRLTAINDARGVAAGDRLLADLAARLRSVLDEPAWHRSEYTLARYDGGALMILARPCTANQSELLGEALRFGVADAPFADRLSVTVSIGIAQHRIGESLDSLLARTERTLHLAKQFGRDRVEISTAPPPRPERAKVVGIHGRRH